MEGKGSFVVLLFIIAILTLTLAIAIGVIFFSSSVSQNTTASTATTQSETTVRPAEKDLGSMKVFEGSTNFNLKSEDASKISIIQVSVEIQYYKKSIKNVDAKLTTYSSEIKEMIGTYFQSMTLEQAKDPNTKTEAKKYLKAEIDKLLTANEKEKPEVVYSIIFDQWLYQ